MLSTQRFCVTSSTLGTTKNLIYDKGFIWSDVVPDDMWVFDNDTTKYDYCINTLMSLNQFKINTEPLSCFQEMLKTVSYKGRNPPWKLLLPNHVYQTFAKNIVNTVKDFMKEVNTKYYENVWIKETDVFDSLKRGRVDDIRRMNYLDKEPLRKANLNSFKPYKNKLRLTRYNRLATKTGRLTVKSGPEILTLKKEQRNILVSQWEDDGHIVSIDFKALEPRVLLYYLNNKTSLGDIYQDINNDLFSGKFKRDAIKEAVISTLYGISSKSLSYKHGMSDDETEELMNSIKLKFQIKKFGDKVTKELKDNGCLYNAYGRRIDSGDSPTHVLINHFIQSTASDAALLGFRNIIKNLPVMSSPIFLLHDALVIDVHKKFLDDVLAIKETECYGFIQKFPVDVSIIR